MEVFLFHAPGIGQDYRAEGPIRLYHSPGLLSMKPPVQQTESSWNTSPALGLQTNAEELG